jgi:hypothetical protein
MQHAIETPSIFVPVSTPAFAIRDLSFFVLAITGAIFVIGADVIMWVPGSLPLLLPILRLIVQVSSRRVVMEGHHA